MIPQRSLAQDTRGDPLGDDSSSAASSRFFVGRDQELAELHQWLQTPSRNRRRMLLAGAAGIGKTALLDEFLRQIAGTTDTLLLTARCDRQSTAPYQAVDQWVALLGRYLGSLPRERIDVLLPRRRAALTMLFPDLLPLLGNAVSQQQQSPQHYLKELRWEAFHSLRELLVRLAGRLRLVMAIDDLQWIDADSRDLLRSVLKPSDELPLFFVGCCRDENLIRTGSLGSLIDSIQGVEQISVGPLTLKQSRHLASTLTNSRNAPSDGNVDADADAEKLLERVAAESTGNPAFLCELVRDGDHRRSSSESQSERTAETMLWNRIQRLPDRAQSLLQLLSVAGRAVEKRQALAAAEAGGWGSEHLLVLRDAALVEMRQSSQTTIIEIPDERVREIVLSRIGASTRFHCNVLWANSVDLFDDGDAGFLAEQFRAIDQPDRAADFFVKAADSAVDRLAFHLAIGFYDTALRLNTFPTERRNDVRAALAKALSSAGRSVEAANEFLRLGDSCDGAMGIEMQRQAFTETLLTGRVHEGVSILNDVLQRLGMRLPRGPRSAIAQFMKTRFQLWLRGTAFEPVPESQIPRIDLLRIDALWCVAVCLRRIDLIRGVDFARRSCLEALRIGETGRIARSLALEAVHLLVPGSASSRRAAELIEQARELANEADVPLIRTQVTMCEGIASGLLGRWQASFSLSQEAEIGYRSNEVGEITTSRFWQLLSLTWLGRLADLQQRCTELVENAEERGDVYELVNLGTYTLAVARLAQDRPREAADQVRSVMERWTQEGFQIPHHLEFLARISILLYEGNYPEARAMLDQNWSRHKRSSLWSAHLVRTHLQHLRVRTAIQAAQKEVDRADAIREAEQGVQALEDEGLPWSTALAAAGRASLEQLSGNETNAKRSFEQAAERFDRLDMGLLAAISRRRVGRIVGGEQGRQLVDAAERWMRAQQIVAPAKMAEFWIP